MLTLSLIPLTTLLFTPVISGAIHLPAFANVFGQQAPIVLASSDNNTRVPILLGVMSRCPDAILCESVFDHVLKQTWGIVNITLSFIGKLNESEPDFGVTCMHGTQECAGNVQELCAMDRASSQEDWWLFVQCVNYEGKDDVGNVKLAERCAGVASVPWDDVTANGTTTRKGMKGCVEGEEGKDLLKASVKQSEDLGITKSCTIMINGNIRCIRDGTWKQCETGHTVEEFVSYIKTEYEKLNQ